MGQGQGQQKRQDQYRVHCSHFPVGKKWFIDWLRSMNKKYTFAGCLKTCVMWSNFSGEHKVLKFTWKPLASTLVRVPNKLQSAVTSWSLSCFYGPPMCEHLFLFPDEKYPTGKCEPVLVLPLLLKHQYLGLFHKPGKETWRVPDLWGSVVPALDQR